MEGVLDVAIVKGKVAEVAPDINFSHAQECFDVKDFYVVPGIIDLHVHTYSWLGGRFSHKMMAEAGVTTDLDMAGPIESVLDIARDYRVGLNLACVQYVRPDHTVNGTDPDRGELEELLLGLPSKRRTFSLKFQGVCFICNPIARGWHLYEGCGRVRGFKYRPLL
ncbi:MAG: hypothetical protein ACETWT_09785 [Thermodesulfobacteriota bacterium]